MIMNYTKFSMSGCEFAPACIPKSKLFGFDPLSIFSGMMGNMGEMATTLMNNSSNEQINNQQLLWTANENQKNKDWQSKENQLARQWQQDFWHQVFDTENAYNTPLAQRNRLLAGGFNPYGQAAQAGLGQGSNVSAPIASTVGSPATQSAPSQIPMQRFSFGAGFKDFAEGLQALASAKKSGVETNRIEKLLSDEIMNQHYQALMSKLNFEFESKYGEERYNWSNEKLRLEVDKVAKECALLVEQKNYQAAVNKFEEQLRGLEVKYKGLINDEQREKLRYLPNLYRSEISRNFASAFESTEAGKLSKQTRVIRTPDELRAGVESSAIADSLESLENYYTQIINNDISEESVRSVNVAYDKLSRQIDLFTLPYDKFVEKLAATANVAADVVATIIPIGKFKQLQKGVKVMEERNELKRKEGNAIDVKETVTQNAKGKVTGRTYERKYKTGRK